MCAANSHLGNSETYKFSDNASDEKRKRPKKNVLWYWCRDYLHCACFQWFGTWDDGTKWREEKTKLGKKGRSGKKSH